MLIKIRRKKIRYYLKQAVSFAVVIVIVFFQTNGYGRELNKNNIDNENAATATDFTKEEEIKPNSNNNREDNSQSDWFITWVFLGASPFSVHGPVFELVRLRYKHFTGNLLSVSGATVEMKKERDDFDERGADEGDFSNNGNDSEDDIYYDEILYNELDILRLGILGVGMTNVIEDEIEYGFLVYPLGIGIGEWRFTESGEQSDDSPATVEIGYAKFFLRKITSLEIVFEAGMNIPIVAENYYPLIYLGVGY